MRDGRFLFGAVIALTVALIATLALLMTVRAQANNANARIQADEQHTCRIQARGLPAGHELSAAMQDIYALLTVKPSTPAERAAAKNTSPHVHAIVTDLTRHLAQYQADEASQPPTRTC